MTVLPFRRSPRPEPHVDKWNPAVALIAIVSTGLGAWMLIGWAISLL